MLAGEPERALGTYAIEGGKMDRQTILKKIVENNGLQILKEPKQVRDAVIQEDAQLELYASQLELFLKSTNLGMRMQDRERAMSMGKAGYETVVARAADMAGFTIDAAESLGEDLLYAAGYEKKDLFYTKIPDTSNLPLMNKGQTVVGNARGKDAYDCARIWMREEPATQIKNGRIHPYHTGSDTAVWAFQYLKRAADDGCEEANGLLGIFYCCGVGTLPNEDEALKYFLRNGGITKGDLLIDKKEYLKKLLENREKTKRQKVCVLSFSALVFFCLLFSVFLPGHIKVSAIWLLLSVANIVMTFFLLFVKRNSGGMYKNVVTGSSLAIWVAFILQICW